jgi:pimeloyl-ACP methyl ester carboxylesterase
VLREFTTDDALTLRADAWGDEKHQPVLLLHGGAQTRHSWKQTARRLAELDYYAVALDLRGHGESDWSGSGAYSLNRYAEDLSLIVNQFALKPIIIGASLGGIVSMLYAGEHKDARLSSLILVDIATRAEDAGVSRIKTFLLAHREGFASLEEAGQAVTEYLKHRKRPTGLTQGLKKNLRRGADGRYYWHWDPAFIDSPLIEEVRDEERLLRAAKKITVPLLLVRGAHSDIVSPEITRHFLEQVPHASYVEVGGAGHTLAGDSNDEFTEAVVAFLKEQQSVGNPT